MKIVHSLFKVKLSLRKVEIPIGSSSADRKSSSRHQQQQIIIDNDKDSGRETPSSICRLDGTLVRRKQRHRSGKKSSSTDAATHHHHHHHPPNAHHSKSQHKHTIEKLMKLILEQGETIQQQLSKLR